MASRKRSSFDSFPTAEPRQRRRTSTPRTSRYSDRYGSTYDRDRSFERDAMQDAPDSAAAAYSRRAARAEYARRRTKKKRGKRIAMVFGILLSLLLVGAGAAYAYVNVLNGKLGGSLDETLKGVLYDVKSPSDPFYVLLMGVDKSQARENSATYAGDTFRSDSMMLVRVDPKEQIVTIVSIVRDTYIEMGENGWQKINAAHAIGGPAYAVEVVSDFAGVPISHYVEVDFDGFKAAVDALGGIEVNVPIAIYDEEANANLEPGLQTLNGDQALALCRSRHAYDQYGAGDFYRAANQRMVLGAVADKLLQSNIDVIVSTVTSMCDYVTTDMKVSDIVNVAVRLRGMDTKNNIYSTMNPTISTYEYGGWYEYSNDKAWKEMMSRIDQGLPPTVNAKDSANDGGVVDGTVDPEYVARSVMKDTGAEGSSAEGAAPDTVTVWNGSGVGGAAATVSSSLMGFGYSVSGTTDADSYDYAETLVVYNDKANAETAQSIADSLGVGKPVKNDGSYSFDTTYLVIVGADY